MFTFKSHKLTALISSLCVILLVFSFVPILRPAVFWVLKVPLTVVTLLGQEVGAVVFYHRNYVLTEQLKKENGFLKTKLIEQDELLSENRRLKELLNFKQNTPFKVLAAQVIGRSADNWSSTIIINKGSAQNIKRGMVVLDYQGLIGRVSEVHLLSSTVTLINDPSVNVSVIIQRSRQEGLACGALGAALTIKYLNKDADVQVGDEVITSGLTEMYPKGVLVGRVIDVGDEFSGLSRIARVKPAVNLSSLEEVFIVVP